MKNINVNKGLIIFRDTLDDIYITDNVIGIEPKKINELFDITQKQSAKGTANEIGSGLGLILCKEFVKKNNGKIWVETQFGKGSSFKFSLPFSEKKHKD
jgi:two-component system, sensor histidine kinase and response regulator